MTDWNPFTAILFVLAINTICSLAFVQVQMSIKWKRLLLAIAVTGCLQYAAFYILSGFGWGWPTANERALLFARTSLGATVGISTTIFSLILSNRWRVSIALAIVLLAAFIFTPDPSRYLALELLSSGVLIAVGSFWWYRK